MENELGKEVKNKNELMAKLKGFEGKIIKYIQTFEKYKGNNESSLYNVNPF
jgi:hypothetical protein